MLINGIFKIINMIAIKQVFTNLEEGSFKFVKTLIYKIVFFKQSFFTFSDIVVTLAN